jgi:hypothetical protein
VIRTWFCSHNMVYYVSFTGIKTVRVVLTYGPTSPRLRPDLDSLTGRLVSVRVVRGPSCPAYSFAIYLKDNYYLLVKMNNLLNDNIKWPKMWLGRDFVLITWSIRPDLDSLTGRLVSVRVVRGPSCPAYSFAILPSSFFQGAPATDAILKNMWRWLVRRRLLW